MIGFLHPWALAGLLAAALPILLHLLARRQPPTVVFPAVRYLVDATRQHERRLRLRHLLLLVVRTLLIILLVLAAAGPTLPAGAGVSHAPTALVLILDNSLSSAAVVGGNPRLAELRDAAREVLAQATPADAVWLLTADAPPRRAEGLGPAVDSLPAVPRRLDLGVALTVADDLLASQSLPGEITLVTDLQATAVSAASPRAPVLLVRPPGGAPGNAGVAALDPGPQPWTAEGGRLRITLAGDSSRQVPLTVRSGRLERQVLASVGAPVEVPLTGLTPGWHVVQVELAPDELRADDQRETAVRVAPPAAVAWDSSEVFVAAACEVLLGNGRIRRGSDVRFDLAGSGPAVVQPPADPAALGAVNRALARRGVSWRFAAPVEGAALSDSGGLLSAQPVARRYRLESVASGRTGVLATVAGEPWIVQGGEVVLVGSRLEPAWTGLPLSAEFMPFMDALLNRVARGQQPLLHGITGVPTPMPDAATAVRRGATQWPVEGGADFVPPESGVYFVVAGGDTLGALAAGPDPRESQLNPADDGLVRRLWGVDRIVPPAAAGGAAFAAAARADLRGPLLWLALGLGLVEVALASGRKRDS